MTERVDRTPPALGDIKNEGDLSGPKRIEAIALDKLSRILLEDSLFGLTNAAEIIRINSLLGEVDSFVGLEELVKANFGEKGLKCLIKQARARYGHFKDVNAVNGDFAVRETIIQWLNNRDRTPQEGPKATLPIQPILIADKSLSVQLNGWKTKSNGRPRGPGRYRDRPRGANGSYH